MLRAITDDLGLPVLSEQNIQTYLNTLPVSRSNGTWILPALPAGAQIQDWLKQNSTLIYIVAAGLVALVVFRGFMRR